MSLASRVAYPHCPLPDRGNGRTTGGPECARSAARIDVLTASVGAGHTRAAEAVAEALAASHLRNELLAPRVSVVDVLDDASAWFSLGYGKGYVACAERLPTFVGWSYERLDRPWTAARLRPWVQRRALRRLARSLRDDPPDAIVVTHFLAAEFVAAMKRRGELRCPLAVVVTDVHPHALWLHRGVDCYFVADRGAAEYLRSIGQPVGLDPAAVVDSGIPIDARFGTPLDRSMERRELGLELDRPVLLVSTGGLGLGRVDDAVEALHDLPSRAQLVVVCGRNDALRGRLERRSLPGVRVLGFTTRMPELMAAADLCVGKPGGLTSSECLARALPMVIVDALPGQEERNAERLLEIGAAVRCRDLATLRWKVQQLLEDPARLRRLRVAAGSNARPRAAAVVAEHCASLLDRGDASVAPIEQMERAAR